LWKQQLPDVQLTTVDQLLFFQISYLKELTMLNIYRASAGSGKTYRLTQDYIHLLFDPKREHVHRRILAVTFTNKATEEMKTRILHELYALASHANRITARV
jgi:superfamily I DNA/RNA helicase